MTPQQVIRRETAISVVISGAISAGFCLAIFGLARPVSTAALAPDTIPQAFMVALMGGLVPGLLIAARRKAMGRHRVVLRAVAVAAVAAAVVGGGGWVVLNALGDATLPAAAVLIGKIGLGMALAAAITPAAVRHALGLPTLPSMA